MLGVQWLSLLGPIVFDYGKLYMSFSHQGKQITLEGLKSASLAALSMPQLRRLDATSSAAQYFAITASPVSTEPTPLLTESPNPDINHKIQQLLSHFQTIFSLPKAIPHSRPYDHRIPLIPGSNPVNIKPYRYPHFQKTEIEKQVKEMLEDGIIKLSTSPFSSSVILVRKKDGQFRFCGDFRALNAITVKDRFPIPAVDELLDELHGAHVFTKLDLRAGYHQIRVHPDDTFKKRHSALTKDIMNSL